MSIAKIDCPNCGEKSLIRVAELTDFMECKACYHTWEESGLKNEYLIVVCKRNIASRKYTRSEHEADIKFYRKLGIDFDTIEKRVSIKKHN